MFAQTNEFSFQECLQKCKTEECIFKLVAETSTSEPLYFPLVHTLYNGYPSYKFSTVPTDPVTVKGQENDLNLNEYFAKVEYVSEEIDRYGDYVVKEHYILKEYSPPQFYSKESSSSSAAKKQKVDNPPKTPRSSSVITHPVWSEL